MSYSISVSGHANTESAEQSRAFEREVLARAREFVARTPGVTGASFSGGHIGFIDLLKPASETQPPPMDRPAPAPEPPAEESKAEADAPAEATAEATATDTTTSSTATTATVEEDATATNDA